MSWTLANKITIGRILLVPLFIIALLYYSPEKDYLRFVAFGLLVLASLTDALDGYLARKWNQQTAIGAILDPLADKMLITSAYVCTFIIGDALGAVQIPLWVVVLVISRDVILLLGSTIIQIVFRDLKVIPTVGGKLTTVFQLACIAGVLLQWPYTFVLLYIMVVLTVCTGVDYLSKGAVLLNRAERIK